MQIVPQCCDDLIAALDQRDTAQLQAWLDQFSAPDECYAALRALAEAFQEYASGPQQSLAAWASGQIGQALAFS